MRLISTPKPKSRLKAYYVANYVRGNAVGSSVLWARTFATKSTFILIDMRVQSKPDRKATLSLGVYITKLLSPITRLPLQRENKLNISDTTLPVIKQGSLSSSQSHPTKNCTWYREVNFVTGHWGGGRWAGYGRLDPAKARWRKTIPWPVCDKTKLKFHTLFPSRGEIIGLQPPTVQSAVVSAWSMSSFRTPSFRLSVSAASDGPNRAVKYSQMWARAGSCPGWGEVGAGVGWGWGGGERGRVRMPLAVE